jgi:hypothetical protein
VFLFLFLFFFLSLFVFLILILFASLIALLTSIVSAYPASEDTGIRDYPAAA